MSKEQKKTAVPKLRFPEFRHEISWESTKLHDPRVCSFVSEKLSIAELELRTYISTENMLPNFSGVSIASKMPSAGNFTSFKKGDVLMSNIRPYLRKVWCADRSGGASNDVIVFRAGENVLPAFLAHILKSDNFIDYVMKDAEGVKMPRGDKESIKKFSFWITQKNEQLKIAYCLSSLDEVITAQGEKVEALNKYKKGLMQQLFPQDGETVPRLRFPEFKKSGDWIKHTIKDLVESDMLYPPQDGNHGEIHPKSEDYVPVGIPFVMANNIRNGHLDFASCKHISEKQAKNLRKGFAKDGDVLLTHKGTVGEVAIVPKSKFPFIMLTPQVTYYRVKKKEILFNVFLANAIAAPAYQDKLHAISGGGTRAYVGITEQGKLEISLPPRIEEQKVIATFTSSLDELIAAQVENLELLKAHKEGLLQQLFPSMSENISE